MSICSKSPDRVCRTYEHGRTLGTLTVMLGRRVVGSGGRHADTELIEVVADDKLP